MSINEYEVDPYGAGMDDIMKAVNLMMKHSDSMSQGEYLIVEAILDTIAQRDKATYNKYEGA